VGLGWRHRAYLLKNNAATQRLLALRHATPGAGCCRVTGGCCGINVSSASGMQRATAQTLAFTCLRASTRVK